MPPHTVLRSLSVPLLTLGLAALLVSSGVSANSSAPRAAGAAGPASPRASAVVHRFTGRNESALAASGAESAAVIIVPPAAAGQKDGSAVPPPTVENVTGVQQGGGGAPTTTHNKTGSHHFHHANASTTASSAGSAGSSAGGNALQEVCVVTSLGTTLCVPLALSRAVGCSLIYGQWCSVPPPPIGPHPSSLPPARCSQAAAQRSGGTERSNEAYVAWRGPLCCAAGLSCVFYSTGFSKVRKNPAARATTPGRGDPALPCSG